MHFTELITTCFIQKWVIQYTIPDVLPDDLDVIVTVTAGLFMVEAKSVEKLMLHSAVVKTAITGQRHSLAVTLTANIWVASVKQQNPSLDHICIFINITLNVSVILILRLLPVFLLFVFLQ